MYRRHLGHILGFVRITDIASDQAKELVLVPQYQQVEGVLFALEYTLHQLFVGVLIARFCQETGSNSVLLVPQDPCIASSYASRGRQ
jgi:hypothetical protein